MNTPDASPHPLASTRPGKPALRVNSYRCPDGHETYTCNRADITTPFTIRCRERNCAGIAVSSMYRPHISGVMPEWEFYISAPAPPLPPAYRPLSPSALLKFTGRAAGIPTEEREERLLMMLRTPQVSMRGISVEAFDALEAMGYRPRPGGYIPPRSTDQTHVQHGFANGFASLDGPWCLGASGPNATGDHRDGA